MVAQGRRTGRSRLKLAGVMAIVAVLLLGGAFGAWKVRKRMLVRSALTEGTAAYDHGDWQTAARMLKRYLTTYPGDLAINTKYAAALLQIRPLTPDCIRSAINAYRQILIVRPADETAFQRLVTLYETTGNFGELEYLADRRLGVAPDDTRAVLARAKGLIQKEKRDQAVTTLEELVGQLKAKPEQCASAIEALVLLSNLARESNLPNKNQVALDWLNRAVDQCPNSAAAYAKRANLRRELARPALGHEDEDPDLQAARADLERADQLEITDPRLRLLLSEEWLALDDLPRARAQLKLAEAVDPESLRDLIIDPSDWIAARFGQAARLALATHPCDTCVPLAQQVLDQLGDSRQRLQVLPLVIQLMIAGGQLESVPNGPKGAKELLDEYIEKLKLIRNMSAGDEQIASLRALLARAENRPYEVISLLTPFAEKSGLIRALLAEAYDATGQAARFAKLLGSGAAPDPSTALLLARVQMSRGNWQEASEMLAARERLAPDDLNFKALRLIAQFAQARSGGAAAETTFDRIGSELDTLRANAPDNVDLRLLAADLAAVRESPDAAERVLKSAIEECSRPFPAIEALVRLYARTNRTDDAAKLLETGCQRFSSNPSVWILRSRFLAEHAQLAAAREVLDVAAQTVTTPAAQDAFRRQRAMLDVQGGDRAAGIQALRDMVTADPQDVEGRVLLLELPEIRADATLADRLVEEIKQTEGAAGLVWRSQQARLWLAHGEGQGRAEQIAEILRYCVENDPSQTTTDLLLTQMYQELPSADIVQRALPAATPPSVYTGLGRAVLDLGDLKLAGELAARGLQLNPRDETLLILDGKAALGLGRLDQARELADKALAANRRNVEALFLASKIAYLQRDTAALSSLLDDTENLLQELPTSEGAQLLRARLRAALGKADDAIADLQKYCATAGGSRSLRALLTLESLCAEQNDTSLLPGLLTSAEALVREVPSSEDAQLLQARLRAKLGQVDAAVSGLREFCATPDGAHSLRTLLTLESIGAARQDTATLRTVLSAAETYLRDLPADEDAQLLRARVAAGLGQLDAAITGLGAFCATPEGGKSLRALLTLVNLQSLRPDFAAARATLEHAAQAANDPNNVDVLRARVALAGAQQQYDEIPKIVDAVPGQPDGLAGVLVAACNVLSASPAHLEAAQRCCDRAIQLEPNSPAGYMARGDLKFRAGDATGAEAAYRDALRQEPLEPDALNNLACLLAKKGSFTEALPFAKQAVTLRPTEANYRDTLGQVLGGLPDKLIDARTELRHGVELAPPGSDVRGYALFHLAQVAKKLEDTASVPGYVNEALAIDRERNLFTPEERAELQRLLGSPSSQP